MRFLLQCSGKWIQIRLARCGAAVGPNIVHNIAQYCFIVYCYIVYFSVTFPETCCEQTGFLARLFGDAETLESLDPIVPPPASFLSLSFQIIATQIK